jgi:hypothetical protein
MLIDIHHARGKRGLIISLSGCGNVDGNVRGYLAHIVTVFVILLLKFGIFSTIYDMAIPRKAPTQYNKCLFCGKESGFSRNGKYIKLSCPKKFCSHTCSLKFRHKDKIVYLTCPCCKKQFRKYNAIDGVARKHCSMKCYNMVRVNHFPKYEYPQKEHKNYKIKKINGKQVLKHRWIMENHLGRKLNRGEVVHHINGDPHDNRIENLMLTTQSQHMKIEISKLKRIQ